MVYDPEEADDVLETVRDIAAAASVAKRELGTGWASDDDVDASGYLFPRQTSNVDGLRLMRVVLEIGFVGRTPDVVRPNDFDPGKSKSERPAADARIEVNPPRFPAPSLLHVPTSPFPVSLLVWYSSSPLARSFGLRS